jgi:hypothetical protein
MGAGFRSFGSSLYREDIFWIASGRLMVERIAVGGAVKAMHLTIAGHGEDIALSSDIAVEAWPGDGEEFSVALWLENVNDPVLGGAGEHIPSATHLGFFWRATPNLALAGEIFQEGVFDPQYRMGQELVLSPLVTLRAGVRTDPASFSAGFSAGTEEIIFDYAWRTHPMLGATQMIGLRITFGSDRVCARE